MNPKVHCEFVRLGVAYARSHFHLPQWPSLTEKAASKNEARIESHGLINFSDSSLWFLRQVSCHKRTCRTRSKQMAAEDIIAKPSGRNNSHPTGTDVAAF